LQQEEKCLTTLQKPSPLRQNNLGWQAIGGVTRNGLKTRFSRLNPQPEPTGLQGLEKNVRQARLKPSRKKFGGRARMFNTSWALQTIYGCGTKAGLPTRRTLRQAFKPQPTLDLEAILAARRENQGRAFELEAVK